MENTEKFNVTVLQAIFEVFERMFFIFFETSAEAPDDYDLATEIKFGDSALKGEMTMFLSRGLAERMSCNMLNIDGKPADEEIADCVKEAINMVCGNFLSKLDPGRIFDLSMPEFLPEKVKTIEKPGFHRIDLTADEGNLGFVVNLSRR